MGNVSNNCIKIICKSGWGTLNNGWFYYTVMDEEYHNSLYRFNCETFSVELVCDDINIWSYSFCRNYILCTTFDDDEGGRLFRIGSGGSEKILSGKQISPSGDPSGDILVVSCTDDRIFVTGAPDPSYTWLAEVDIDGNVIEIIHDDTVYN